MKKSITEIIKVAGIYMMLNIGAGFTSGREILQFFAVFGYSGLRGILITFLLMFYGGESLIDAGWRSRHNPRISVFEYFGGRYLGSFYNIIIPLLSFGSYILIVAGAGAVLEQFFNIPNIIGRIIVTSLAVASVFFKFQYLLKYLSYMLLVEFLINRMKLCLLHPMLYMHPTTH